MALVIDFTPVKARDVSPVAEQPPQPKTYNVEVTMHPNSHIEFTAHGVKSDAKSLYEIACELEKIASIIRSDVITKTN